MQDRLQQLWAFAGLHRSLISTLYLSLAHTDEDIRRFLTVARTTLRDDCHDR